jgi:hypothetical protein
MQDVSRRRIGRLIAGPIAICLIAGLMVTGLSSAGASEQRGATKTNAELLSTASNCVKGTAQGVTSSSVRLAITVVNITGGSLSNATVGVPSAPTQENYWNAVARSINNAGGAGCRKLKLSFFDVNPVDAASAQQVCLAIAASHPFMVLDVGALSDVNASNCIPAAKVPFASQYITPSQLKQYYPYYLSLPDLSTGQLQTSILALGKEGYFKASKGFKKLGVIYDTCDPSLIITERAALKQAGVPSSKVVYFNLGCPAGQAFTPAGLEQAVLQFKSAGLSDVTSAAAGSALSVFTQVAGQQNYKPQYLLASDLVDLPNSSGAAAVNYANLNGAVNAATVAYGEQSSPGFVPTGGTKKCNTILQKAGYPTVYKTLDGYGGVTCNYLWFAQGILNHATSLQPSKLPAALHSIGSIVYSYPFAPVDYAAAPKGSPYGRSYWRIETFKSSCKCWNIPNPAFSPPVS